MRMRIPAITGQATLVRGDYEFAGRKFELRRGVIRFAGEVPANALLHIGVLLVTTVVAFAIALRLTRRRLLK